MQHIENDCKVYRTMLFDYVSDLLSDEENTVLCSHIEICPHCSRELAEIKSIIGAAASLPEVEAPDGLRESVAEQIAKISGKAKPNKIYSLRRFASVALPLAACAVLAIGIYSNGLLDNFIKSDDILSSPVVTDTTDNTHNNETSAAETDVSTVPQLDDNGSAHINTFENKTESKSETPSNDIIQKEGTTDTSSAVNETPQNDVSTEKSSNIGTVQNDIVTEESESLVAPASAGGSAVTETDQIAAYNSREITSYPASCTIIVSDLTVFAASFGGDATNDVITISISADNIDALMAFAAEYAIEISFEYSDEYSDTISVTAKGK